ncbi:hypothetical protein [Gracilimonas mengyeensis]|uniref:Uncharacterized protein n=1 Tax=Gracilimonas mengyeensis TaxID=1302730 RepID=A0A521B9Y9_9BACT|nr:hypothetical protein [Gracilimonas mengyeensis]SMO43902.1 hypothetical protein SAMN06265219_102120 [Gracilimonas mengyeensis]
MSTSSQNTSAKTVQEKLRSAFKRLQSRHKVAVVLRAVFIVIASLIAITLAEELFYLSVPLKTGLLALLSVAAVAILYRGFKELPEEDFTSFYRKFSRASDLPELKDTLDLEKSAKGNRALIDAAILQNLSRIKPDKLSKSLNEYVQESEASSSYKKFATLGIASIFVLALTAFNFSDALLRTTTFWQAYQKPNPYNFAVYPGNVTLEQGSNFEARIDFQGGSTPEDVTLQFKTSVEKDFRSRAMEKAGNSFTSLPMELNNDMEYFVLMDGYRSDLYSADVQLRPRFSALSVTQFPPTYTQLDSTTRHYPFSELRAYQGTNITLKGTLNKTVAEARLLSADTSIVLDVQDDLSFTHSMQVTEADTLRFYIEDQNELSNKNPFQITVVPLKDEYPLVSIEEPEDDIQEVNPQAINLLYQASDDFGLTAASLNYELTRAYVEEPITGSVSVEVPGNGGLGSYSWNLEDFGLRPQDELTFWVTVTDNDGYQGYKSSRSESLTLTVPSLVDYFDEVDEKESEVEKDLDDLSESFKQTQDQYEQFKEKMRDNPEQTGYEEKQQLEQVRRQQEEVQKRVDELNKKFEELKNELSRDNMLSEDTQKAYEELQKLMKEIDDPALMEALQKMQEELGQMNPDQMREAMENLEFNEELYRERLERTLELFKQLKLNSDLDKLARSFEDMARKAAEQAQKADSSSASAQEMEQSLKENEKLKQQVDSLSQNTSPKNENQVSEYQEETRKELDELMKEMKKKLDGQKNGQQQQQSQSSEKQKDGGQQESSPQERYEQLATKTQKLMEGMSQQQMNINIAGLQYVLYSLLNLSLEQEELNALASSAENRSQAFVTYARDQRNIEEIFNSVSDSLFSLSKDIPQLSNQINKRTLEIEKSLDKSLNQMSERNRNQASVASRQSLGGINELSFMIMNLLEQLQQGGSGGGSGMSAQQMMQQMQQTGESQQQLNQRMQEMINDMQGDRLTQNQMERLNQIAKEQNRIRKQLEEMQRSGELDGNRIGSELQRMIEDMEDTINDLRGGSTDPMMIKRQQNILSRMLEAEKAMQEQDEENKREGNAPEEFARQQSPEMTLEELEKEIRNRLNDPNFTKYSPDYQRLIENYFELLKELQEQNREIQ